MRFFIVSILALSSAAASAEVAVLRERTTGCPSGEDLLRAQALLDAGRDASGQPRPEAHMAWLAYTLAYKCVTFEKGERIVVERSKRQTVGDNVQLICLRRESTPACSFVFGRDLDARLISAERTSPRPGGREHGFVLEISP
jgi:hypothetical protein